MLIDDLLSLAESAVKALGASTDDGEEFRRPPLDILRYHARPVRLGAIPILGRGLSVVALARHPVDLGHDPSGHRALIDRIGRAVNGRYSPWKGLSVGLTVVDLTAEPITPDDDGILAEALASPRPGRCVPLGLLRINLGQEALAMALAKGPDDLYREPEALADALTSRLRRFVPMVEGLG